MFSVASCYISPEMVWPLFFFGLAFPYLAFASLILLFFLLLRKSWWSLIVIFPLLLSISQIGSTFQLKLFSHETFADNEKFKVMSFNVRTFNRFGWIKEPNVKKRILGLVGSEHPDILCIQEFYNNSETEGNLDTVISFLSGNDSSANYYFATALTDPKTKGSYQGEVIFSRFPVANSGKKVIDKDISNFCLWADIVMQGDTVRVFNVHMQSIRFSGKDYTYMEQLKKEQDTPDISGFRKIIQRMKLAAIKRSSQAAMISELIAQSPYPIILCGDFNDPPTSYTYTTISRHLIDAFVESGWGFAKTYSGVFPSFRIDNILYSVHFESSNYRTVRQKLSDHFPVVCDMRKRKK